VFPEAYQVSRALLGAESIVVVSARVEVREDRGTRLLISDLKALDDARRSYRRCLHIEIRAEQIDESWLATVDEILCARPGDCEVYLHIVRPDHSRLAMRSRRFRVAEDETLVGALRERLSGLKATWGRGPS
jgi:DNA polymerase III alpha subunit